MAAKLACFLHLQPSGLCVGVQRLEVPPARALASCGEWRSSDESDFRRSRRRPLSPPIVLCVWGLFSRRCWARDAVDAGTDLTSTSLPTVRLRQTQDSELPRVARYQGVLCRRIAPWVDGSGGFEIIGQSTCGNVEEKWKGRPVPTAQQMPGAILQLQNPI